MIYHTLSSMAERGRLDGKTNAEDVVRFHEGVPQVQPRCSHGATEDEACPECLGAPSDDPDAGLRDQPGGNPT